jgi:hypothetical protein
MTLENKKPVKVGMYMRVGNASQITHKEGIKQLTERNNLREVDIDFDWFPPLKKEYNR